MILPKLKLEVQFDITCEDGVLHYITIHFVLCWFKHRLGKTEKKTPFICSLHIDAESDETVDHIPFHLHDFHESTQKEGNVVESSNI